MVHKVEEEADNTVPERRPFYKRRTILLVLVVSVVVAVVIVATMGSDLLGSDKEGEPDPPVKTRSFEATFEYNLSTLSRGTPNVPPGTSTTTTAYTFDIPVLNMTMVSVALLTVYAGGSYRFRGTPSMEVSFPPTLTNYTTETYELDDASGYIYVLTFNIPQDISDGDTRIVQANDTYDAMNLTTEIYSTDPGVGQWTATLTLPPYYYYMVLVIVDIEYYEVTDMVEVGAPPEEEAP